MDVYGVCVMWNMVILMSIIWNSGHFFCLGISTPMDAIITIFIQFVWLINYKVVEAYDHSLFSHYSMKGDLNEDNNYFKRNQLLNEPL